MAKLNYISVMSLDGFIGDGHYDWSLPAEGSTAFITEVIKKFPTYLYGRKNYETMSVWDDASFVENMGEDDKEFARVWRAAKKVVFSKSLISVKSANTRIEKNFEIQKIREMKDKSPTDLCIGGPTLASQALKVGLVDEMHLFVVPDTIGNTIPTISVLPKDFAIHFELIETRAFSKNWIYLHYGVQSK
jgi:dihydrofolate reductase